jgi:hypothetical protein
MSMSHGPCSTQRRPGLKAKGKTVMNGPQSFSVYDSVALKLMVRMSSPVDGLFHFAPYYRELAEACGFEKCIDWSCNLVKENR